LTFSPGVTALVGPNGAGKTTLMRTLAGALVPTSGSVRIAGLDPYAKADRLAALAQVAWMPQIAELPKGMRTIDLVAYLGWMRGQGKEKALARAEESLRAVGLTKSFRVKMGALSGGMVRRVWLAQALAADAEVLLLDEPSTGLDPRQRETMVRLIRETAAGTVLLSSHLLEDVKELAERIVVLDHGRVAFDGPLRDGMDAAWFIELTGDEADQ
jgi:ABC-2 type transport system ATP-binding protein